MKLKEIIYDLKLIISNGKIPDDSKFDNRLIVNWINNQRSLWLTNTYNKKVEPRNNEVQVLNCVDFTLIDSNEYDDINTNITLLKSDNKIPRTLDVYTRQMITAIRPLDAVGRKINFVNRERAIYSGNGILNRDMLYSFIHNDYMYIKYGEKEWRTAIPRKLRLEGVFENPLEVDVFNNTIDNIWDGINEYPISRRFIDYIKAEIIKLDIQAFIASPLDDSNDDENKTK